MVTSSTLSCKSLKDNKYASEVRLPTSPAILHCSSPERELQRRRPELNVRQPIICKRIRELEDGAWRVPVRPRDIWSTADAQAKRLPPSSPVFPLLSDADAFGRGVRRKRIRQTTRCSRYRYCRRQC